MLVGSFVVLIQREAEQSPPFEMQASEAAAMFLFFPLVEAVVKEVIDSVGLDLGG